MTSTSGGLPAQKQSARSAHNAGPRRLATNAMSSSNADAPAIRDASDDAGSTDARCTASAAATSGNSANATASVDRLSRFKSSWKNTSERKGRKARKAII